MNTTCGPFVAACVTAPNHDVIAKRRTTATRTRLCIGIPSTMDESPTPKDTRMPTTALLLLHLPWRRIVPRRIVHHQHPIQPLPLVRPRERPRSLVLEVA